MEKITADLAAQHAELRALLVALTPERWHAPSLCPGWDIADVVLHLAQTDEIAMGSARATIAVAAQGAGWDMAAMGDGEANVDEVTGRGIWEFVDAAPITTISGSAETFCLVAARRLPGAYSGLMATGPDADAVLELVRTFA